MFFWVIGASFTSCPLFFHPTGKAAIEASDALFIYGWSYLSMGPEANLEALKIANAANVPVFYDPGPEIPNTPPEWRDAMIEQSTVVLLTDEEATMIIGERLPPEAMAERIRNMGPELVILKLGAEGMIGQDGYANASSAGLSVAVKDLTVPATAFWRPLCSLIWRGTICQKCWLWPTPRGRLVYKNLARVSMCRTSTKYGCVEKNQAATFRSRVS